MNVLVIGATGGTGRHIVNKLRKNEKYTVIAGIRKENQVESFKKENIKTIFLDVRETVNQIAEKLSNIDAVIFSAGFTTSGDTSTLIDLDGKVKVAKALEKVGIKRFILVSAGGIHHFHDDDRLQWMNEYEEYSAAMYYSDQWVENSSLDYTIVRPGHLINEKGTGLVEIGEYLPHKTITREDVASVVVSALENDNTIRKAFDVINGNDKIENVVKNI